MSDSEKPPEPPSPPAEEAENDSTLSTDSGGALSFWAELKRRKVVRVAITYAIVAWLIIQIAAATFPGFEIPMWAFRFVVLMLILGFPVALILAWAFELTPEGIKLTKNVTEGQKAVTSQGKRGWLAIGFAAVLPTVIFGALAVYFYASRDVSAPEFDIAASEEAINFEKSIAVLPLENMSPDAENAFFAGGVQEDILTNLSKISAMRVISRSSTMDYAVNRGNLSEIGTELNVRYLVEGSVRRAGNRVRVTVQLIDASMDQHIWAENYDRDMVDIFAIQSEIAQAIATKVQAIISPEELNRIEKAPTSDLAAYDLYVRARDGERSTAGMNSGADSILSGIQLMEESVQRDPDFALGWGYLGYLQSRLHWFYSDRFPDVLAEALSSLEKAETLDPKLAEVQLYFGYHYYWGYLDYARATERFALALSIQPNLAQAFVGLSIVQNRQGRIMEKMRSEERGLELDPRSPYLLRGLVDSYLYVRRNLDAQATAAKLLRTDPTNRTFKNFKLKADFAATGDVSDYMEYRLSSMRMPTSFGFSREQAFVGLKDYSDAVFRGDFAKAERYLKSEDRPDQVSPFYWQFAHAEIQWLLGKRDLAKASASVALESADIDTRISGVTLFSKAWQLADAATLYAMLGERAKVERMRATARQSIVGTRLEHTSDDGLEYLLLPSYLALGDTEEAFAILEKLMVGPSGVLENMIRIHPWWRAYHGDPRFEAILAKAKPIE